MPDEPHREKSFLRNAHEWHISQTLLAIVVVLLVIGALRITAPVTLPLAFAIFLIAVFWPLQRRLEHRVSKLVGGVVCLLIFLGVVGLFLWGVWESAEMVAEKAPQYKPELERIVNQLQDRLRNLGIPLGQNGGQTVPVQDVATSFARRLTHFSTSFVLVIAFFLLGLLEVHDFREKLSRILGKGRGKGMLEAVDRITTDFVRYIVVRTGVGLVTGTLVTIFCWIIGLDFALIWGLTNFLLNYIPTLGSIVAVIPPVLFALVSFASPWKALLVLAGVGGIQLIMGQYVDPLVQGRYLALSPIVVLLSVAFWGWLWGIAGAFISIPITVAVVIACEKFDRTKWIATLLADVRERS